MSAPANMQRLLAAAAPALGAASKAAWRLGLADGAAVQCSIVRHAAAKSKGKQPAKGGKKDAKKGQPAKKGKMRMDSKPFDEKDPLNQRVLAYMTAPRAPPAPGAPPAAVAAAAAAATAGPSGRQAPQEEEASDPEVAARTREYTRMKMREYNAWRRDLHIKLQLKQAALAALPPDLRAAAEREDLTPFPLTRHFLYDSAPEAYRD